MELSHIRAWWHGRQGLDRSLVGVTPRDVLAQTGWARSVGGANPYVTLFARSGTSRAEVDTAVQNLEIYELPSARGCTYVVPAEDFSLALTLARGNGEASDIKVAKQHLGVTDAELENLSQRVLDALANGPLDPASMKPILGDAVRNLGAEGKKRGQTTTLPLVLGRLQVNGLIRRVPVDGRLDQQRYAYARWENGPTPNPDLTPQLALTELARRFFRWTGPATLANFQWFSGAGVKVAKEAIAPLGLVPIEVGSEWLIHPDDLDAFHAFQPSEEPSVAVLTALDSLFLLRRDVRSFVDPVDQERTVHGDRGITAIGQLQDLANNAIVDRGRLIGLWEYEVSSQTVVSHLFVPKTSEIEAALAEAQAYIREQLGDCRSFSLDSPASRQKLIDALRTAG